jgi:hypothetical protein
VKFAETIQAHLRHHDAASCPPSMGYDFENDLVTRHLSRAHI